MVVTNDGTGVARDVVLAVQLPAGLAAQSVTISPPAASEWTGKILWVAWGELEPGASATVELHVLAVPGASGPSEVIASIPDYGVESHADLDIQPQVLPETGVPTTPWWGWAALVGALVLGGMMLLYQGESHNQVTDPEEDPGAHGSRLE